jgi:hypothetical protein
MEAIKMNVENIQLIFLEKIKEALDEINDPTIKITLLKKIANQSIDNVLNRTTSYSGLSSASITAMFSGRGRAWAKVSVDEDNPVWVKIKEALTYEMETADTSSEMFRLSSNMLDLFKSSGIAWLRFGSSSKGNTKFHLRLWGSKLDEHIKIYVDNHYLNDKFIQNLEGVPHKLGLEEGSFAEETLTKKEIINVPVSKEELNSFGIQTLEDVLNS